MSRRRPNVDISERVLIDCLCGNHLAKMERAGDLWVNADTRAQPIPARFELDDGGRYVGRCRKCGTHTVVRQENLQRAITAVHAAGLRNMPMRGL